MLKENTISFVTLRFCAENQRIGDKNWTKSISELVEINPVILAFTIFGGSMLPNPSR